MMICPYCDREAPWVENKEIYGKNFGESFMAYYCKLCDAYTGCNKNTKEPMGTMANPELRKLRKETKKCLEMLWITSNQRKKLYVEMSEHFGFQIRIGYSDIDLCNKIIEYAKELTRGIR